MKINYFNFKPWKNKWLITNEQGRYAIVPNEEFQNLIHGRYEQISEEFLEELKRKYFIFDENEEWIVPEKFASKASNTPFIGEKLYGKVKYTICNGKIVYRD